MGRPAERSPTKRRDEELDKLYDNNKLELRIMSITRPSNNQLNGDRSLRMGKEICRELRELVGGRLIGTLGVNR